MSDEMLNLDSAQLEISITSALAERDRRIAELEKELAEHCDDYNYAESRRLMEVKKVAALEEKLQAARPFMQHDLSCSSVIYRRKPCNCGYAEALEKIGKEGG